VTGVIGAGTCAVAYGILSAHSASELKKRLPVPGAAPSSPQLVYHQIWYQGEPPPRYDDMRASCRLANPEWKVMLHDEAGLRKLCAAVDEQDPTIGIGDLFDQATTMHERIDAGRLAALYAHGGVSVDMDMYCVTALEDAMKKVPDNAIGVCRCDKGPLVALLGIGRSLGVNNAVFFVPQPQSPALLQLIRILATSTRQHYDDHPKASATARIMNTWGPHAVTRAVLSMPPEAVVVLDAEEQFKGEDVGSYTGKAAVLHMNEGTWQKSAAAHNMRRALRPLVRVYAKWTGAVELVGVSLAGAVVCICVHAALRRRPHK
jgi:hypothetical protein